MTTRLRVGHVTTCRSDYGPAYWLIHDLFHTPSIEPLLFVGGAHLAVHQGETVREIERDGWSIAARIPFLGADGEASPHALAAALSGFGDAFDATSPDLVILYGDRVELLAAATAATVRAIPIAHICGGDITEGAIDDQVRHAVTKLAHVHFPSTTSATQRLLQMGEEPWRVHHTGDPALDHFTRGERSNPAELEDVLGFIPDRSTLLVTMHPTTLDLGSNATAASELVEALRAYAGPIVITAPAPDPGSEVVRSALAELATSRPSTVFVESLGSRRYRSLLPQIGAMVGNSSSGLIEAPEAGLPVVNIGSRQAGRDRGANVIDVEPTSRAIGMGIARALDPVFRSTFVGRPNPYGNGTAARSIVELLAKLPDRTTLLRKRFVTR